MRDRRRSYSIVVAVAISSLVLGACGSQVKPKDFVNAQNAGGGAGANGSGTTGGSGATTGGGSTGGGSLITGGSGGGGKTSGGGSGGGGSTTGGGTTSGGGSGGGGKTSGGSKKSGGGGTTSGGAASGGVKAGSCKGFKNTNGITGTEIPIANVADLSGPVPGLFKSAQAAVTAYVAYFNSTTSICGRKLKLQSLDSQTSESGDQQAATTACGSAFAMVGSFGAFDAGGASTVAKCGIPDLRAGTTETARTNVPNVFGTYSLRVNQIPSQPFEYFKKIGGDAYKHAAFVDLNAGAASLNANSFIAAESKLGYKFTDKIAIDVTSLPNYGTYATQLKSHGVKFVQYVGAYQYMVNLQKAFAQQNYHPITVLDPTAYDANYVNSGGSAVNNTYVFIAGPLFSEANKNPSLAQYLTWLQRTSGGAPSFFGVYAWSAAALFTQLAIKLGGKLNRGSLINALKGVHKYTNNGMVPPQDVGGKQTPNCLSEIQLNNGNWVRKTPYPYSCGPLINSGVGG